MSVSRCLGPAVAALSGVERAHWKAYIDALPETCPHSDCTAQPGCRGLVAAYFRLQWNAQARRERAQKSRGATRG